MSAQRLRVVLTNDDGPPSHDSPYIYGLYRHLTRDLGWDVKVVIPSTQKSWIGKAYQITDIIRGRYYYPRDPDGAGEISNESRPLKEGEVAEWVLLDGTPATCANIALHNLYPGQIDLLISGPNLGRNSSAAFALSSGTIGAALSSSLSKVRSIAVSYATITRPIPDAWFEPAHQLASGIIRHLWDNWGRDDRGIRNDEVDLYSINVPMLESLLGPADIPIYWTRMWRNSYGRLFTEHVVSKPATSPAGPDSLDSNEQGILPGTGGANGTCKDLVFKFSPEMGNLINPTADELPVGSDGWAIRNGWVSVTPMRAAFAEPPHEMGETPLTQKELEQNALWKVRL
ncbi:survival protein sure-like phosphatase/nucleotidase [Phanerochaete sordida]|uniref:Survival protein sure-like phosphatase/nucleotidase n=1 Tax=Phanerochaete sordida TaxID=48140 RepID=A0A9P3FZG9_9APHY|nr:survival protein sure-like phosphatase/nucleotidase [Phanerochaete sordida]